MIGRLILVLLILSGCHLGHPPPLALFTLGPFSTLAAEPGLDESVRRHLTAALARREALGEGSAVAVAVLSADTGLVASSSAHVVYEARLSLSVQLTGPAPRQVVLSGKRTYSAASPLAASTARAAAFDELARELMSDAADWLLLSEQP